MTGSALPRTKKDSIMQSHWFRVPLPICHADDMHFLRRRCVPTFQYLQDVLSCWNAERGVKRYLAQRAILREVKVAGLLKGVYRLTCLSRALLKHKRLTGRAKVIRGKHWIEKAGKIKYKPARLDPTVKFLAVTRGALVACKGNYFRRRYAYRECADYSASVWKTILAAQQAFAHKPEQNTFADELSALRSDDSGGGICNALKVTKR